MTRTNYDNDQPLVSVVIPCRNEKKYIEQTLRSLLSQENLDGNFEILVVDGMSNDGTKEVLKRFEHENKNLRVIDNPKIFTSSALNLGIQNAEGKYISILGAHAEYAPDYLYNCLKLMEEHPEVSCAGGPIISKGKNLFSRATALAMSSWIGVGNAKHRFPDYEGYAEMACFPMFRKSVFDEIGLYDEKLIKNQDDELCFRLTRNGGKVYISPRAKSFYYVRDSPKNLFKQYFQYGYWRFIVLKKHKIPISYRQQVPLIFFLTVFLLIVLSIISGNTFMGIILPLIYLSIIFLVSFPIFIKEGFSIAIRFPVSVFVLHFSYASGFLSAISDFIFKKKKL